MDITLDSVYILWNNDGIILSHTSNVSGLVCFRSMIDYEFFLTNSMRLFNDFNDYLDYKSPINFDSCSIDVTRIDFSLASRLCKCLALPCLLCYNIISKSFEIIHL